MRRVRGTVIVRQNGDYRNEATVYTGGLSVDIQINHAPADFVEAAKVDPAGQRPAAPPPGGPVFTLGDVRTATPGPPHETAGGFILPAGEG